jgi:hypothetical protein
MKRVLKLIQASMRLICFLACKAPSPQVIWQWKFCLQWVYVTHGLLNSVGLLIRHDSAVFPNEI